MTKILHCHWWEFWACDMDVFIILSIIFIKNEKLINSNNNRSKPKFVRRLRNIVVLINISKGQTPEGTISDLAEILYTA